MKTKRQNDTVLKKNDVVEIRIDGMGYDGEGIAHVGGYTVFIRYALPGERVRAAVILAKPTFAVAKLMEVLSPSPDRCAPFCPVYYRCGGCALQHMTYDAQLRYKRQAIADTFFKTARLSVQPDAVVPSPQTQAYRNKMSLPVRGTPAEVGFFAVGSHRVVPISACPIQFADNGTLIRAFLDFLHANDISGYNETDRSGVVRHLVARKLDGFYTVTVVCNRDHTKKLQPFDKVLRSLYGEKYAYYVNENTSAGNRILGEKSVLCGGEPVPADIDGLKVNVHPHAFFQVNDGIRALLYRAVTEEAAAAHVVDAYSGAGVLGALLSRNAKLVTAVEIEPQAVRSAQDLLIRNGVQNVRLVCGDCATELPAVLHASEQDTAVVLDPPRAGCSPAVCRSVLAAAPRKIVYVSCNPATLARDLALFTADGAYEISSLRPFDMFPHTPNVETLGVLSHKKPDSHIEVKIDMDDTTLDTAAISERAEQRKPKDKPTYKKMQAWIEENYGFKVHTGYIAEVKRNEGLPMYDAPNAVEELKHPRPHPTPQMVEAIKAALKHFEII